LTDRNNPWERFFDAHAPEYMTNVFTRNTLAEVDFIVNHLNLPTGSTILDIGCGTGRHSVELAKRGYKMTGVDLSSGMLAEAAKAAKEAGVEIELIHADATTFESNHEFDAAICLCEGAFALLSPDDDPVEHDTAILQNTHAALKPGAPFVLTTLSALKKIRQFGRDDIAIGLFDPMTLTETCEMEFETPEGKQSVTVKERGYVPTELKVMLRQNGFDVENMWGGTAGHWAEREIDPDEYEIMVIAHRV
jgi:cyclopropane fatty-acyl-phospholipid synthase-like methyltransferase